MAVLLQFNEQTSLTVQQLGENTGKRLTHFVCSLFFRGSFMLIFFL